MTNLTGKRVLVTRPRKQASKFVDRLHSFGAVPVIFPTIEVAPMEDNSRLDQAIANISNYQWIIFTSANGVDIFWQHINAMGLNGSAMTGVRVAAIGPATAKALNDQNVQPDFIPSEFIAEAILPGLGDIHGRHILLPRAEIARKTLVEMLSQQGAIPDEIPIYHTLPADPDPGLLAELDKGVDIATFTSSSTLHHFYQILGSRADHILQHALVACIGPITAATAQEYGIKADIVATTYTTDGLIDAILAFERSIR